ncbi:MAG: hypothetical protein WDM89_19280 [Rhizomicrobium sp.]
MSGRKISGSEAEGAASGLVSQHARRARRRVVGIVGADGRVSYLKDRLEIDQAFLDEAGPRPEQRFRFSGMCVEHRCKQWDGCKCTVIENVIENAATTVAPDPDTSLRPCSIRPACRWFDQRGGEACRVCVFVITDTMEPAGDCQPSSRP